MDAITLMNEITDTAADVQPGGLPFDPSEGTPIPILEIDSHLALSAMTVGHLLQVVPDPIAAEKPERVAEDARLRPYAELRTEVQRLVEGAKKKNAVNYGRYLVDGYRGEHPYVTPPITLYYPSLLKTAQFGVGVKALILPHGVTLWAIDGETQRIGWQLASEEEPALLSHKVPVVIHHGKPVQAARQHFYDLNTREVKPNAAVAIAMDTQDPATKVTRAVMDHVEQLRGRVNLRRRQLRKKDPEVLTISGLRTGIVATILGEAGLQVGSRPITLPDGVTADDLEAPVVELWGAIVEELEDELEPDRRSDLVVSAPSILAGLGVLAHQAMPSPPRDETSRRWTLEEVVDCLADVQWERSYGGDDGDARSNWDGVAGKFTPKGRFSIGGPKEVGHTVANALKDPTSPEGRKIRGEA